MAGGIAGGLLADLTGVFAGARGVGFGLCRAVRVVSLGVGLADFVVALGEADSEVDELVDDESEAESVASSPGKSEPIAHSTTIIAITMDRIGWRTNQERLTIALGCGAWLIGALCSVHAEPFQ